MEVNGKNIKYCCYLNTTFIEPCHHSVPYITECRNEERKGSSDILIFKHKKEFLLWRLLTFLQVLQKMLVTDVSAIRARFILTIIIIEWKRQEQHKNEKLNMS